MRDPTQRPLSDRERLAWLRLARSENVGPIIFRQLIARFGNAESALEALPELARSGGRGRQIRIPPPSAARRELDELQRLGAHLIGLEEPLYPEPLAAIEDAPPVLICRGRLELLSRPAVAIVGARNASGNGRTLAARLAADLSAAGFLVVSGLARGIDTAAHEGALESGTAAVLACGVDVAYPPQNRKLQAELGEHGLILTERAPGAEPQARHFPRRNRIISGLSLGVVVVEAAVRSGSLITARCANDQGREVFAVPGSPLDARARGCNALLREGATLVESAEDVLQSLAPQVSQVQVQGLAAPADLPLDGAPADTSELGDARSSVLQFLGPTATPVDEVVRQCQLSAAIVSLVLLELELAGRIERQPGNRIALVVSPE